MNQIRKFVQQNRNSVLLVALLSLAVVVLQRDQQKLVENLCIVGCGGGSKTRVDIDVEVANRVLNEFFSSQIQSNAVSAAITQEVKIKGVGGDVSISGLKLRALAEVNLESWQKMQNTAEIQDKVKAALAQSVDATTQTETSGILGALTNLFGGKTSKTNLELTQTIVNETTNRVNVEQINECLASAYIAQKLEVEDVAGGVSLEAVELDATAKAAASCVGDMLVKQVTDTVRDLAIATDADIDTTLVEKGILESLFGGLSDVAAYGIIAAVIVVVIVILVLIVMWAT
jgi:copper chaperone CopZ